MDVMKPLVSTSVLGLVPLPQQPESNDVDWKRDTNVEFSSPQPLGFREYCHLEHSTSQELVLSRCDAGRMGFFALLLSAIWWSRQK